MEGVFVGRYLSAERIAALPEPQRLVLEELLRGMGQPSVAREAAPVDAASAQHDPPDRPGPTASSAICQAWPRERLEQLHNWLPEGSKLWRALVLIAQNRKGYTNVTLYTALGVGWAGLPGVFGSIGKFIARYYKGLPRPYEQIGDTFTMEPAVAEAILDIDAEAKTAKQQD